MHMFALACRPYFDIYPHLTNACYSGFCIKFGSFGIAEAVRLHFFNLYVLDDVLA